MKAFLPARKLPAGAAVYLDPTVRELDEGVRFPLCQPHTLENPFRNARLTAIQVIPIDVPTRFRDFNDFPALRDTPGTSPLRACVTPNLRGDSMSRRETTAIAFSLLAALSTAGAQNPTPSASPAAPAIAPSQDGTKPPMRANRDTATTADARSCLDLPTNLDVIKCAEKYRQPKRNG